MPKHLLQVVVTFRRNLDDPLYQSPLSFTVSEVKVSTVAIILYDVEGVVLAIFPIDTVEGVLRTALADPEE